MVIPWLTYLIINYAALKVRVLQYIFINNVVIIVPLVYIDILVGIRDFSVLLFVEINLEKIVYNVFIGILTARIFHKIQFSGEDAGTVG